MGIIAFIKVFAFISSIVGRIIAIPFVIVFHFLRLVVRALRKLKNRVKSYHSERKIKKVNRKEVRKEKALQAKLRKKNITEQKKVSKKQKQEQKIAERKERHNNKLVKRKERQNNKLVKRKERQFEKEKKRRTRELQANEKKVRMARKFQHKNAKSREIVIPFLKGNTHLYARILRKMYWMVRTIEYHLREIFGSMIRKCYWTAWTVLNKCYWIIRTIFTKVYWKLHGIFQKIYWKLHGIFQKIYWKLHGIFQKIYWKLHSIFQKIYWKLHSIFQKTFWKLHSIFQKVYWKLHGIFQKIYWKLHGIFQKVYWKLYGIYQKIYWKIRSIYQIIYWAYYKKSREIYAEIIKNPYADLFFVFFRGYLKKSDAKISCIKISGVKEFVNKHKSVSSYRIIESGTMRTVCIPEFFEKNKAQCKTFMSPDIYLALIPNVDLIGGSNVLVSGGTLLNDTAAYDKENRMDIRYSAIKKVINGVAIIYDNEECEVIERGINLVGAASFNYYHLLVEILSRLTFVDYHEEYREYPLLVDEVVMRIPQFKSALECINHYKHSVVVIQKEKKYHVKELILPSSNVWMPTNLYDRNAIRVEDFLIADSVLHNIRKSVGVWEAKEPWRKIFISRKNTQAVRLRNEKQVREIFEQNGFEIVFTEEMSFREQVECFGQAKCVVATSGAALTNTIFCQKGAIVGCIIPSEHRFYMYSTIAHLLGLVPKFLDAQIIEKTPYAAADTFELDEKYVERYVDMIKEMMK